MGSGEILCLLELISFKSGCSGTTDNRQTYVFLQAETRVAANHDAGHIFKLWRLLFVVANRVLLDQIRKISPIWFEIGSIWKTAAIVGVNIKTYHHDSVRGVLGSLLPSTIICFLSSMGRTSILLIVERGPTLHHVAVSLKLSQANVQSTYRVLKSSEFPHLSNGYFSEILLILMA